MRLTAARHRRLAEPCGIEELAPAVSPACGLDDRAALAIGLVEPAKASVGVSLHQSGIKGPLRHRLHGSPRRS